MQEKNESPNQIVRKGKPMIEIDNNRKIGQRENENWKIKNLPNDLKDRRVEVLGQVNDRKTLINMLTSKAQVTIIDFEDSIKPIFARRTVRARRGRVPETLVFWVFLVRSKLFFGYFWFFLVFLRFRCFFGEKYWFSLGFVAFLLKMFGFPKVSLLFY